MYKKHTRNQRRMYRIHKQEEKIQVQELIISSLQERIDKARKHIELLKEFDEANFGEGAYSKDWEELLEILRGDE